MPSPPSYGCCTRVNFVLKKHLIFQMNLSNSGLKNRSIKEYWLIFTVLKFPLGLQFSHNLTKFKIIKYISTTYIMTTTCIYLQQLTQVSDVAHGPLVYTCICSNCSFCIYVIVCIYLGIVSSAGEDKYRQCLRPIHGTCIYLYVLVYVVMNL